MKHFKSYGRQDLLSETLVRKYETKLGEKLLDAGGSEGLPERIRQSTAQFVVAGVPESIGVVGNGGLGGTETAWPAFLRAFVNMQSADRFSGEEVMVAGHFDFEAVAEVIRTNARSREEKIDACRHAVANLIDGEVEELVRLVISSGKIPILIGGGHNNAYPMIKGTAKALFKSGKTEKAVVNAVNLDAHADFRIMEGRHSGNGFRYAKEEGYLGKYAVLGLQELYNAQSMLDDLYSDVNVQYQFYENLYLQHKQSFTQAVAQSFQFTEENFTCVEMDLDVLEAQLASASCPSGISVLEARQYMHFAGLHPRTVSVHICEGASRLEDGREDPLTGRLIAILVADFIKAALTR